MSSESAWWVGQEAVQIVGHSAAGGGVPVIFAVMDATAELGMVPVVLATHPDVVDMARADGRSVWEFPGIVREPHVIGDLLTAFRLAAALRRRGVRIVHTHTSKAGMVGRLAARIAGCDLVLHHTHGFYHAGLRRGLKRALMRGLERFFGRLDDRQVFINSSEFDSAVAERIASPEQARLCFNGIAEPVLAAADRAQVRAMFGLPLDAPIVGTVCRIDFEQKGLDAGLAAFALVARRDPETLWAVAGAGEDLPRLEHMVADAGLSDRVILLGRIAVGASLHRAFDVTFAPSRREGQSVSALEAMACGTAVVTTRIPGNSDLIEDGRSGVLVEVDDVASMADALVDLLDSPESRASLGREARASYERAFTRDAMVARVQALYREALGLPVSASPVLTPMRGAHVAQAVRVHLSAFPGFFLTQLGAPFLRAYYASALRDPSCVAFVAVDAGRVRGVAVGSTAPGGFYRRLLASRWWLFGLAALPAVMRDPRVVRRVLRALRKPGEAAVPEGVAGLFSLAVAPDAQGEGLGGSLLEHLTEAVAGAGCSEMRLETDAAGNERANEFYRGHGFEVVREYTTPEGRRMLEYGRDLRRGAWHT